MRANRLLTILLYLQTYQHITTCELAKKLEVSQRTIHRDMDVLSSAGFPIYAERGRYGGWKLLAHSNEKIVQLDQGEIPSLFVRLPEQIQQELGIDKNVERAQLKLLATLPENIRKEAEYSTQRIYLDSKDWHPREENHLALDTLIAALWSDRKVNIHYERSDGEIKKRLINPLGLVAKGSLWYLVAMIETDIRTYRVSRIHSIKAINDSFKRPANFDLASYWKESMKQFVNHLPKYLVTAHFDPQIQKELSLFGRWPKIEIAPEKEGKYWRQASFQFETQHQACAYMMSFGKSIEVLTPTDLRIHIKRLTQELTKLYFDQER